MSVCATITSRKRVVHLDEIVIKIIQKSDCYLPGKKLKYTYFEDNVRCQFYKENFSTRPIDISKEEDGWEVRITTLASEEDYELFVRAIDATQFILNGKIFSEDGEPIISPWETYGPKWREEQMRADYDIIKIFSLQKGQELKLFGPIRPFCLGRRLFSDLNITEETDWKTGHEALIERFRYSQYSRPANIRCTSTNMQVQTPDGNKIITIYRKNAFDMISAADYFLLIDDIDNLDTSILMRYNDFIKVAPPEWERFDDKQFFTTDLSDEEFQAFYDRAIPFNCQDTL